ncbi:MAG: D-2-hydroxyacid dehydrogenase [Pseudomonadales bacterium]
MTKHAILLSFLLCTACAQPPLVAESELAQTALPEQLQNFSLSDKPVREIQGWQRPSRILVAFGAAGLITGEEDFLDGIEVVTIPGAVPTEKLNGQFDAIFTMCAAPQILSAINDTLWVHSYSAGVEGCLSHQQMRDAPDILLTNSRGAAAEVIAEHAIAMMLSLGRQLHLFRDAMAEGKWDRNAGVQQNYRAVNGQTMLVLGLGSIGRETAKRAHGLGMKVVATRNSSREGPDYVSYVGLSSEAMELAAKADVVVNALPLTEKTRHLINEEFLAAMPAHSMLINVGRGGSVDTNALIAALQNGSIGSAGLDVTEPEPLPSSSPLWSMPNVLITPHIAASSRQAMDLTRLIARENLKRYIAGEKLINPVNRSRAY